MLKPFKDRLHEVVRDCQQEFIRGKSCTSNPLEVLDHVGSLLDNGNKVDIMYMNMSKARFDKVNHARPPAAKVSRVRICRQPLAVVYFLPDGSLPTCNSAG